VGSFLQNIEPIADALSTHFSVLADYLCHIADPLNPPSVPDLSATAEKLHLTATQTLPEELSSSHTHLTNTLTTLLSTHLTLQILLIQTLSQTQHGTLTRHTKSTADLLATRSTLLGLEAKMHALSHPAPPEFVAALKEFGKQQGKLERGLREREELANEELKLYGKAGEKGMLDLARRKKGLEGEIVRCEGEIQKLEKGT
jgi:hypothetical protein